MAPVIVSKRGFLALVLWVLNWRNGCRVIIKVETGDSNLVSFGPRIRALARYFTSAFASVKYLSQRRHPRAKTWHKIWMTGLNPTNYTYYEVRDEINYPFLTLIVQPLKFSNEWKHNLCRSAEVISNFIWHLTGHVITYTRWDQNQSMLINKSGTGKNNGLLELVT